MTPPRETEFSVARRVRVAGVLTLLFIASSITHFAVFEQPLLPERTAAQVAEYVRLHPAHLRAGIVLDSVVFALGALLAVALFAVVKDSAPGLAHAALALMLLAFGVSMAIELSSFAMLGLVRPGSEVLEPMLVAVTQTRAGGYALVMFVYSLGLGIAFALLPRAGAVPKVLGLLGAAVCAMLFASTAGQIVAQEAFKLPVMVASSLLMLYQLGLALLMVRRTDGRGPAAHS